MIRFLIITLISITISASTLYLKEEWGTFSLTILYLTLIIIMISISLFTKVKYKYNSVTLFLMLVFLIFGIIASLYNQDLDLFLRANIYFILLISANIVIPSWLNEDTEKVITKIILLTHIPILFIPILVNGFDEIPYYGIFSNPNSIAGVAVTIFAVFFAMIFNQFENIFFQKRNSKIYHMLFYIIALLFTVLIISYALSRTSFVTALIVFLSGMLLFLVNAFRLKKIGNVLRKGMFVFLPLILILYILNSYLDITKSIENNIIGKFQRKSRNVLASRDEIWNQAINNSSFFGNGAHYFQDKIGLGAHNTFVSLLGTYGWIPMLAILLFFIIAFYYVIKYFFKSESKYKYVAPLMLITFLTLSLAEDMNWKLSIIASLILSGFYMNKQKIKITK
ncbi:MAG TPA: hypothetical protein VK121_02380 [Pseudogracilibacillus sp.]|nr:hypothetical protein [Pseudogracilibacillus sp.]